MFSPLDPDDISSYVESSNVCVLGGGGPGGAQPARSGWLR